MSRIISLFLSYITLFLTFFMNNLVFAAAPFLYVCIPNKTSKVLYLQTNDIDHFGSVRIASSSECPAQTEKNFTQSKTKNGSNLNTESSNFSGSLLDPGPPVWVPWNPGQFLYVEPSSSCLRAYGIGDCHATFYVSSAQSNLGMNVDWRTFTTSRINTYSTSWSFYLRPCYRGGSCNFALCSAGVIVTPVAGSTFNLTGWQSDPTDHIIAEFIDKPASAQCE